MSNSSHRSLVMSLLMLVVGMVLLAYAAVPLYNLFCKATGYGGTTKVTTVASSKIGQRKVKVHFDANIEPALLWEFAPEQSSVEVITGENVLVFYYAYNYSSQDIIATAVYNITPHKAGKYFNKIQCFCFVEQLLTSGQKVHMPVSFFIDAAFDDDPEMKDVNNITLSYSFFRIRDVEGGLES